MNYTCYRYWSITLGKRCARIAVNNEQGDELFALVPQDGTGAQQRAWRTKALDGLEDALRSNHEPGLVRISEED